MGASEFQGVILEGFDRVDPESIGAYVATGGYASVRSLATFTPESVVSHVEESGLLGRGGSGYPVARKWRIARETPGEHRFVVANAYDADALSPIGRVLLEHMPHRVVEGMIIAAYAVGAAEGVVYCRGEAKTARARVSRAISQAEAAGFLGPDALGPGRGLRVRVALGRAGFIGGEETTAIAAIEGRRANPSQRPPYPAQQGLLGLPTVVHSAETLAILPALLRTARSSGLRSVGADGPVRPIGAGTHDVEAPGPAHPIGDRTHDVGADLRVRPAAGLGPNDPYPTPIEPTAAKVFSIQGDVRRRGLIELPLGVTLSQIIELASGPGSVDKVRAVQIGGPTGACVPAEALDAPLTFESLRQMGAHMGSGRIEIVDRSTCMAGFARDVMSYLKDEACGKCVPCRIGTKRMAGILEGITSGLGQGGDLDILEELSANVSAGSICGFGITAPSVVTSTLKHFRADYLSHIEERSCPTGKCTPAREFGYRRRAVL